MDWDLQGSTEVLGGRRIGQRGIDVTGQRQNRSSELDGSRDDDMPIRETELGDGSRLPDRDGAEAEIFS
jgi:hypothetical protein